MSRDPVTLLTQTLADRAASVAAPPAGLADDALRQARARRRHQVAGAAVAAVAVVAGVLAPSLLPGSADRADPPAGPTAPLEVPDGVTTRVAPDTLARGADPGVAWTAGAILRRSDGRSVGLPAGTVQAAETLDGAMVAGTAEEDAALRLIDLEGHSSSPGRDLSWPVAGAHGQLGYLDRGPGRLVTQVSGGAGEAVDIPFDVTGASLVGWLGESAVVANVPGAGARLIGTGGVASPLRGLQQATATDGRSTVASRSVDRSCLEVRRAEALLWRSCGQAGGFTSVVAISPNGHHALVRRARSGGGEYAVVDAETGAVVRLFRPAGDMAGADSAPTRLGQAVFETDDDVLLAVSTGEEESVVRCSLGGACEVAAQGDLPDGPAGPQPFVPSWVP